MTQRSLSDKTVKKNPWIKSIIKASNYDEIAELIKKRIESSETIGPIIFPASKELSTDILVELVRTDHTNRFFNQIHPAISLLLFKLIEGEIPETSILLRGVLTLIKELKLKDCNFLLGKWISKNKEVLSDKTLDEDRKFNFKEALITYAKIQNTNDIKNKNFWIALWSKQELKDWWNQAFYGLRHSDIDVALKEIPRLISRKLEKTSILLYGMWIDNKDLFEKSIKDAINKDAIWGSVALNNLFSYMSDDERQEILFALKG